MSKKGYALTVGLTLLALGVALFPVYRALARGGKEPVRVAAPDSEAKSDLKGEEAAISRTSEAFIRAFDRGDAKAIAALWTRDCEYVAEDGSSIRGRDAIEKAYAEFFKNNPKRSIKVKIDSIRLLGKHTAQEEGTLTLTTSNAPEPSITHYSVLHIREGDGWQMAVVREWGVDPAELVSVKDVEWLLGEWEAKTSDVEVRSTYEWDEAKRFIRGRHTIKENGKVRQTSLQIIGKDPAAGQLRSWIFDSNGGIGEAYWTWEDKRWVLAATGTLPDGSTVSSTNLITPLDKDAFTWQSVERMLAGINVQDTAPVKVTRVKSGQ